MNFRIRRTTGDPVNEVPVEPGDIVEINSIEQLLELLEIEDSIVISKPFEDTLFGIELVDDWRE